VESKHKVIPVILGSTETISKSFRKCLTNIMGKQEIKELNLKKKALHTYFG